MTDKATGEAARAFLRTLGVKRAEPAVVIKDMILPVFRDDTKNGWKVKGLDYHVGCAEYAKDHVEHLLKDRALLDQVGTDLWLKYVHADGNRYTKAKALYLSKAYGGSTGLEKLFRGIDNVWFVDPAYLNRSLARLSKGRKKGGRTTRTQKRAAKEEWAAFFRLIGVETRIRVVRTTTDPYLPDYSSPHLKLVFDKREPGRATLALRMLDEHWEFYRRHLRVTFGAGAYQQLRGTPFLRLLTDAEWVPTRSGTLCKPTHVFVRTPATSSLLGEEVQYLADEVSDDRLVSDLGMNRGPTVAAVLDFLRGLVRTGTTDVAAYRACYQFLAANFAAAAESVRTAFRDENLCYVPGCPTPFFPLERVLWRDVSKVFGSRRGYLRRVWPEFKQFFLEKLGVRESPVAEDYAYLLRELSRANEAGPTVESAVWAAYTRLEGFWASRESDADEGAPSWWVDLIAGPVFWTDAGSFVANRDRLFVNDRDDLYATFKGCPGVNFLKLPGNQYPRFMSFIRAAGVPLLSQAAVVTAIVPTGTCVDDELTAVSRTAVEFLIQYLFFRETEAHRELAASGVLEGIGELTVHRCSGLAVQWTLAGVKVQSQQDAAATLPAVYVGSSVGDATDLLGQVIAREIGHSALDSFISLLISKQTPDGMEKLLESRGIRRMSGGQVLDEWPEEPDEALVGETPSEEDAPGLTTVASCSRADSGTGPNPNGESVPSEDHSGHPVDVGPSSDAGAVALKAPQPSGPVGGERTSGRRQTDHQNPRPADPAQTKSAGKERGVPPQLPATQLHSAAAGVPPRPNDVTDVWVPECSPAAAPKSFSQLSAPRSRTELPTLPIPGVSGIPREPPEPGDDREDAPDDLPHAREIGRWGEGYVVECLREQLTLQHANATTVPTDRGFKLVAGPATVAELTWANRNGEWGGPYDILLEDGNGPTMIEVKSTSDESKSEFQLSRHQWDLARTHGMAFLLARVFNAGKAAARVVYVPDPYGAWREGRLIATPVRIIL